MNSTARTLHLLQHLWLAFPGILSLLCNLQASVKQVPESPSWHAATPSRLFYSLNGTWMVENEAGRPVDRLEIPGKLKQPVKTKLVSQFVLPDSLAGRAIFLHVLGVNNSCWISLNGAPIASHAGGMTSFEFELKSELLKLGAENKLAVEVDPGLTTKSTIPLLHRPFGWPNPGGILRDIYLEARPALSIDGLTMRQVFADNYKKANLVLSVKTRYFGEQEMSAMFQGPIDLTIELSGPASEQTVTIVRLSEIELQSRAWESEAIELPIPNPQLWSPESPVLYSLELRLSAAGKLIDARTIRIGLYDLQLSGSGLTLNGRPFSLRAISWRESLVALSGGELEREIDTAISRIKAVGMNAVYALRMPPHPRFIEKCSEAGLFVLEEIPLYCATAAHFRRPQFIELAQKILDEMIERDRLQPAVFGWGIGAWAETSDSLALDRIVQLGQRAKNLDNRPVFYTARAQERLDKLESVDVLLIDFFEQEIARLQPDNHTARPVMPIFGYLAESEQVENSSPAHDTRQREAEEIQAQKLEQVFERFARAKTQIAGWVLHTLKDWELEKPLLASGPGREAGTYSAGLIDGEGRLRIGFRMASAYNMRERKPQISPATHTAPTPAVFPLTGVLIILVFLYFMNRDKKLRVNLRRIFVHPHGVYSDLYENRKIPVFLSFLLGILQGAVWGVLITSAFYYFRKTLLFDEILDLFFYTPPAKAILIWLVWHPAWLVATISGLYLLLMLALAFILRLAGLVFKSHLPFQQYFTLVFWTAACYLPLALLAPIFFRLLPEQNFAFYSLIAALAFVVWHLIRLQRGLRVFYVISPLRSMAFCALLVIAGVGLAAYYFNRQTGLLDYVDYYMALIP